MNRRDVLGFSASLLLSAVVPGAAVARARQRSFWGESGPGVQLYALEPDLKRDLPVTLAHVARLGFRSVELASMHDRSPKEMRAALDSAGLRCRSAHVAASSSAPGARGLTFDDIDALADDLATLGARAAVLPLFQFPKGPIWGEPISITSLMRSGAPYLSADRYRRMADFLNETGAILAKRGIAIGYHNSNFELAPLGETTGLRILLERTDPRAVQFELDAGWIAAGGHDPVEWLGRYPGRFSQLHIKDIKPSTAANFHMRQDSAEVGAGALDWPRILAAARACGVRHYYLEQDPPFTGPRIEALARSLAYLSTIDTA